MTRNDAAPATTHEHIDVLIIGAGLSGIGAAYHLQQRCPDKSYQIIEARQAIGGTWDLFRYPGIRSDSDMQTLGYAFRPWRGEKVLADGASIRRYIEDTARENGIDRHIRFGQRAISANWNSDAARWTVTIRADDGTTRCLSCQFLYACSGYYNYAEGYTPVWPSMDTFQGRLVHPQHWPENLDYRGKRIVVIGSGATAVTLVPSLCADAAHVTLLQRSPSYVFSLPSRDKIAQFLNRSLPASLAHHLIRWKNILIMMYFYNLSRLRPQFTARALIGLVRRRLPDVDIDTHFTPRYAPWDQRLCFVPDADLFRAIRSGKASIVTDEIARFTHDGLQLKSGKPLTADIIVTATGLNVQLLGGMTLTIDDMPVAVADKLLYKGMMLSDVPNFAVAIGYTNASWTLKCDLSAEHLCRLINYLQDWTYDTFTPRLNDSGIVAEPAIGLSSGYIQRARQQLPKQGSQRPWRLYQNYLLDLFTLRHGKLDDAGLTFGYRRSHTGKPPSSAPPTI